MVGFPRSNPRNGTPAGLAVSPAGAVRVPFARRAHRVQPDRRTSAGYVMTCGDGATRRCCPLCAAVAGRSGPGGSLNDTVRTQLNSLRGCHVSGLLVDLSVRMFR
jgi:hypothetical protein